MDCLEELNANELKKIEGGKNLFELAVEGIGYLCGAWVKYSPSSDVLSQSTPM
jgi:bacteriocin-like protein